MLHSDDDKLTQKISAAIVAYILMSIKLGAYTRMRAKRNEANVKKKPNMIDELMNKEHQQNNPSTRPGILTVCRGSHRGRYCLQKRHLDWNWEQDLQHIA